MNLSIFTPTHDPKFLRETWDSIKEQPFDEWLVMGNNGCIVPDFGDNRVRILQSDKKGVGALKLEAATATTGDVLVELDHDDIMAPTAIDDVKAAFANDSVEFVFSNHVEFNKQADTFSNPPHFPYSAAYGWRARPFSWNGFQLHEQLAFAPTAHCFRRIWWAPNHLRAWRRKTYEAVGGHDAKLEVGDDHDLLCRTYVRTGTGGCRHIDKPLYLQRVHEGNTQRLFNDKIQVQSAENYLKFIEPMSEKWAAELGLPCIDLGGRINGKAGFKTLDLHGADINADLRERWPLHDSSVGVLRAHHVLEHLPDSVHSFNEAFRVLAPGGFLFVEVPSATGKGAFRDPTHKSFFVDESFWYYTNKDFAQFIRPQFVGRFQESRIHEYIRDGCGPVVAAELIALKEGYNPVGEVKI